YRLLGGQSEERVRESEVDQTAVVFIDIVIDSLLLPPNHIHRVRLVVAIVIAAFGPQELLPALNERETLRGEEHGGGQLVHGAAVGISHGRIIYGADHEPVPERVIVVALDVVDRFQRRIGEVIERTADANLHLPD